MSIKINKIFNSVLHALNGCKLLFIQCWKFLWGFLKHELKFKLQRISIVTLFVFDNGSSDPF